MDVFPTGRVQGQSVSLAEQEEAVGVSHFCLVVRV